MGHYKNTRQGRALLESINLFGERETTGAPPFSMPTAPRFLGCSVVHSLCSIGGCYMLRYMLHYMLQNLG